MRPHLRFSVPPSREEYFGWVGNRGKRGLPLRVTIPTRDNDAGTPPSLASTWSQHRRSAPLHHYRHNQQFLFGRQRTKACARTAPSRVQERTFHLDNA